MKTRNWFITGISSGLGLALSEWVMESGDFVIGTFRNQEQVAAFNQQNKGKGFAFVLDLSTTDTITQLVANAIANFGHIDVLVNNAGVGFVGAIEETSLQELTDVFTVNVFAPFQLVKAVIPFMRAKGTGHIIQISSHGGIKSFAGFGVYNASKFALEGFSEALAQEVASLGIKVIIVEPGPFRTNFAGNSLIRSAETLDAYVETAGAFITKLEGVSGKQEGDPVKAAKAITAMVNANNYTLRLPLGKIALQTIQSKIDSIQADLEKNRSIAAQAVYD